MVQSSAAVFARTVLIQLTLLLGTATALQSPEGGELAVAAHQVGPIAQLAGVVE